MAEHVDLSNLFERLKPAEERFQAYYRADEAAAGKPGEAPPLDVAVLRAIAAS